MLAPLLPLEELLVLVVVLFFFVGDSLLRWARRLIPGVLASSLLFVEPFDSELCSFSEDSSLDEECLFFFAFFVFSDFFPRFSPRLSTKILALL